MTNQNIFRSQFVCCVLGVALMVTLTGCPGSPVVNNVSASAPAAPAQPDAVAQPVVVAQPAVVVTQPVVVAPDPVGLVYYPNYAVYYDPSSRVYWHSDGGRWSSGAAPVGVSVDVLQRSPSARMNFHDSPANHHSAVVQKYPRDWKP
jgi:hypothetical protein